MGKKSSDQVAKEKNQNTDLLDVRFISNVAEIDPTLAALSDDVGMVIALQDDSTAVYWRLLDGTWQKRQFAMPTDSLASIAKMRRGDTPAILEIGGENVVGVDRSGRLVATLSPGAVEKLAEDLAGQIPDANTAKLSRGDSMPLVEIGDEPILGLNAFGHLNLYLDDSVLDDIAARLAVPGGRVGSPDLVPDFDAWNVRQDGEMIYFNAHLWGPTAREYLRYGPGDPWANAGSETLLRLVYGDEFTDTAPTHGPEHVAHILTFNDDAGQAGLNGEDRLADATDIQRCGRGFAATAADSHLKGCTGPKRWQGVRSETVMGAELAELIEGPGFNNLIDSVDQFRAALTPYKRFPAVQTVSILQGATEDSADYADKLLTLCSEVSQQVGARQFNCYQPVGDAFKGDYASTLQTLKAFVERGALPIVLVSPIYWCARRPGSLVQITPEAMTKLAELDGLAGKDWLPPLAFVVEREGSTIHIDFEVMKGFDLVAPTYGLSIVSDNDAEITGWEVAPDPVTGDQTRLTVQLSEDPVNGLIRYAYNNIEASFDLSGHLFCSGGDMRDSWSAPSVTGGTLHRYAFSFEFKV